MQNIVLLVRCKEVRRYGRHPRMFLAGISLSCIVELAFLSNLCSNAHLRYITSIIPNAVLFPFLEVILNCWQ